MVEAPDGTPDESDEVIRDLKRQIAELRAHNARLSEALRSLAEGNLGDASWQANYDRIRDLARAALSSAPATADGWRDDHHFAVVSANFARPFLLGAYATMEAATLAQCGQPDRWLIYERAPAAPTATGGR